MTRPIAINPDTQKDAGDCSLMALSMLTGVAYVDIRRVAKRLYPKSPSTGLIDSHILRVAKAIGHPLTRHSLKGKLSDDLEEATGLLHVVRRDKKVWHGHAVVLFEGVVIDPHDRLVWSLDAYLAESRWILYSWLELL